MANRRSTTTAKKVEYPACARHSKPRKDVRLRHFFLCDGCAAMWSAQAFDGAKSLWDGENIEGYCHLCNNLRNVRMRTWFLCDICWRVAGSIGRNHVAEKAILDWWRKNVESEHPHLVIVQNDESSLRPRRDTDVSGEGPLDFLITDTRTDAVVLGIENKTGRSSIKDMSAFQLDISDCDSISHHVRDLGVPCYLVHAQVLERWNPPTMGFEAIGLWWTDIYKMADNFRDIRTRQDEQRGAAYFKKAAFHDMDALRAELLDGSGELALMSRFRREGLPDLYESV
jgi:hypothetical protein